MTECANIRVGPLRCPTRTEILEAALALLPRGRAWQSNEGGPIAGVEIGFQPGAFSDDGFSTKYRRTPILRRFWTAVADVFAFANSRLCDLRTEFFCATRKETDDLWMAEYGLPDDCDPFPDLCVKVAALGGARCEYFSAITARMGWEIECFDGAVICGSRAGHARAGRAQPGFARALDMRINVRLRESPAYGGRIQTRPLAGRLRAGMRMACAPDISPLKCLMDRIVPAHVRVTYTTA